MSTEEQVMSDPKPRTAGSAARPGEISIEAAARGLAAATSRPLGLGAWREVSRTGTLAGDPDPDSTAAGFVRRWHQHLAVAMDLPMERLSPGEQRLPELVTAWLDLARRTAAVRQHVAATGGPRAAAETARQRALLAGLLGEDLAALDQPEPARRALELLDRMAAVAAAEDAAGRVLRPARRALLPWAHPEQVRQRRWLACPLSRLVGRMRPAPLA